MLRTGSSPRRGGGSGFTLLELIIVLVVLAALAALVVPVLGWVRDQSKYATAAAGAAEVLNNLETYKASTGNYPNRMDTLIGTDGAYLTKAFGTTTGQTGNAFPYGAITPASSSVSYFLANSGITEVMQHTQPTGTADPNTSSETLAATPVASATFLTIDPATVTPFYEAKMRRIVRAAFPNQTGSGNNLAIPTGHTLIALGIGSRAATSGTTMTNAPLHGGAAKDTYSRFIGIFDVSAGPTGRGKVQLKLVTDSEFEVVAKNVENFKGSGPVDDQGVYVPPPPPTP